MNMSQIHLALTHLPVVLSLTGLVVLAFALIRRNQTATRISFYILAAAGVTALPVFFSGEGAEEIVEKFPGVSESIIDKHEEFAQVSLWVVIAAGIISLAGLFIKLRSLKRSIPFLALVFALGSTVLMALTAHYGGQIRHSEIRSGMVVNNDASPQADDDDD